MATTQITENHRNEPGSTEPDPKRFWALAVIALAQLIVVLDACVVIVALPSAQRALHISVANRQWVMTAYTLAFGSLLLLGGRIADYLGRRRMFIVGLIGFAIASALGGLAQDSAMLFGARGRPRCFCRPDGARCAVPAHGDVHRGPRTCSRLRRLWRHCRRWSGHRSHPRGIFDPIRIVALDPAHQRPIALGAAFAATRVRAREPGGVEAVGL